MKCLICRTPHKAGPSTSWRSVDKGTVCPACWLRWLAGIRQGAMEKSEASRYLDRA